VGGWERCGGGYGMRGGGERGGVEASSGIGGGRGGEGARTMTRRGGVGG